MIESEQHTCCICEDTFTGFGHNPEPFGKDDHDRACEDCNDRFVVPMRLLGGRIVQNTDLLKFVTELAKRGRLMISTKKMISIHHKKAS